MGNHGRTAWTLWFNVFMRPILTVFGFVAGMLCYSTFAVFFHTTFEEGAARVMSTNWYPMKILAKVAYSVIYLGTLYAAANTCFKLLDVFPNHLMRWLGEWGAKQDTALLDGRTNIGGGLGFAGASLIKNIEAAVPMSDYWAARHLIVRDADMGLNNPNSVISRAAALSAPDGELSASALERKQADAALARARLSAEERNQMNGLNSQRDKDRFLQHKFLEQENKRFKRFGFEQGHGYAAASSGKRGSMDLGMLRKGHIGGMGFDLSGRAAGEGGQRGGRDNNQGFRALDGDPSLGRGQLAGASIGDSALDNALSGRGGSGMNGMTELQQLAVKDKIEKSMSSADALNYKRMSGEEQKQFIREYYETDPELFAPGIGRIGTDHMFGYIAAEDELKTIASLGLDKDAFEQATVEERKTIGFTEAMWQKENRGSNIQTQWGYMTREEKARVADSHARREKGRLHFAESEMSGAERLAFRAADVKARNEFMEAKYAEHTLRGLVSRGVVSEKKLTDLSKANEELAKKLFKEWPKP
jgi:hypothetical protein